VFERHRVEVSIALSTVALAIVLAVLAPHYFSTENLTDLFLANMPVLIIALGMTLIILAGQIDISVGSIFAICGVAVGVLTKANVPVLIAIAVACAIGTGLGAVNGALVAFLRLPSIVVTLATMVIIRQGLLWYTQGAWIQDLPRNFQWFGLAQSVYPLVSFCATAVPLVVVAWILRNIVIGRAVYATGSNEEAARLAGFRTDLITFSTFAIAGALTGFASVLNSVRFNQIPSNAGVGLELKVIAAVVVGGTAITGGRGSIVGTALGVIFLGAIGPALTFLAVNAYWEKGIQGAIILVAVSIDALRAHPRKHGNSLVRSHI
jgi:rhamnose transport system permease protein